MALEENGGMGTTMLVQPSGGMMNGGFGGFGGDGWWIILLFILLGGWGGGFGGGGDGIYPWMNQSNQISNGFQNSMLNDSVTSIRDGVFGITTQLSNGFAQAEIAANGRQMADMNRSFDAQTAMLQGFTGLQGQLAQCCCDNRLATCQTQNIVQNEGAATRLAIQQQTQAILDEMCQQEIDNLKAQNLALQNQVNMQALAASQATQTAALIADNTAQTQYIVNRVAPYPIPSYAVTNPTTPAA